MTINHPTLRAPHIRAVTDLTDIQMTQAIALIPVGIAAVLNTGYQYLWALNNAVDDIHWDWSDRAVYFLGLDYQSPSLFAALMAGMVHLIPVLVIAILSAGLVERAFSFNRNLPMQHGYLLNALVFSLLTPPAASLPHVALGMIFAMVFGKGVFGGEGKTFLNPALLGVAFVQISFPTALSGHPLWVGVEGYNGSNIFSAYDREGGAAFIAADIDWWSAFVGTTQGLMGATSVLAITMGAGLLVWKRIASWRLIAGQLLGLILISLLCNMLGDGIFAMPWYWHLVLGTFAFGTVFVATDPASSACTDAGRWVQGFIMGGLVVLIRVVNDSHPDGVIAALLAGSVLAPLIDYIVAWFNIRHRAKRYG